MELVQEYLEIKNPSHKRMMSEPDRHGIRLGRITNELMMSHDFYYTTIQMEVKRDPLPIYTLGNTQPRSFSRGHRTVDVTIEILLSSNDLYMMLREGQRVTVGFYEGVIQGRIAGFDPHLTGDSDMIARVMIEATEVTMY